MAKSTYDIRVAGTVPLDLLENFRQIETVEPAGTILHAVQLDDAALWGLIDALRGAGIDLIEIQREINPSEYSDAGQGDHSAGATQSEEAGQVNDGPRSGRERVSHEGN